MPRQLCLQALRYSMGELADTARRRLTSLPDPNLCPRWTTVVTRPPALELGADDVWVTPVAVAVAAVAALSDGRVVTGGGDGRVRLWRTDQPGLPVELGTHHGEVTAVAALSDGRVVSGVKDGRVRLWRTDQPGLPVELGTHHGEVTALAALSDGRVLSGVKDGRVRLWRTEQPGVPVELVFGNGDWDEEVTAVAEISDGRSSLATRAAACGCGVTSTTRQSNSAPTLMRFTGA